MNKETRTWIIGLLIFISGWFEMVLAVGFFRNQEYLGFIIGVSISIYCLYHGIRMIKKTIL